MVYTVTFNPALDYVVEVEHFLLGIVNRTEKENILPGGKGINVSVVLKNLGVDNTAFGFLAGFTGEEIERKLEEIGIHSDMIKLKDGFSRINVKLKSDQESEINARGPYIESMDVERLLKKLNALTEKDFLVLAGSIPNGIPDTIYQDIMEQLSGKGVRIVVDATNELLWNVLKYRPFLIKPNKRELGELFGIELQGNEQVKTYAKKVKEEGAQNVLISMAGEGAILLDERGTIYESEAPHGVVKNSVGAGDSMVAGFLTGYLDSGDCERAFYMGIAAGSASAFSTGLATRSEVETVWMKLMEKRD